MDGKFYERTKMEGGSNMQVQDELTCEKLINE